MSSASYSADCFAIAWNGREGFSAVDLIECLLDDGDDNEEDGPGCDVSVPDPLSARVNLLLTSDLVKGVPDDTDGEDEEDDEDEDEDDEEDEDEDDEDDEEDEDEDDEDDEEDDEDDEDDEDEDDDEEDDEDDDDDASEPVDL